MEKPALIAYLRTYAHTEEEYNHGSENLKRLKRHLENLKNGKPEEPEVKYHSENDPLDMSVGNFISSCIGYSLLLLIGVVPVLFIVSLIFPHMLDSLYAVTGWAFINAHPFLTYLILAVLISFIIACLIFRPMEKSEKKSDLKKLEDYQKQCKDYQNGLETIPTVEAKVQGAETELEDMRRKLLKMRAEKEVHENYLPYALELAELLETGRADTAKEAVNLLENELRENARDREMLLHHQALQKQVAAQTDILYGVQEETTRAANAAESSAAWSAMGTLLTASEIDRQRKKDKKGF